MTGFELNPTLHNHQGKDLHVHALFKSHTYHLRNKLTYQHTGILTYLYTAKRNSLARQSAYQERHYAFINPTNK